jgi:hypothetical protein
VSGLDSFQDDVVIMPKLFRRLVDYLRLGDPSLTGFSAFLDQAADRFFILSTGHCTTGLDEVVAVQEATLRLTHPIEDLASSTKTEASYGGIGDVQRLAPLCPGRVSVMESGLIYRASRGSGGSSSGARRAPSWGDLGYR